MAESNQNNKQQQISQLKKRYQFAGMISLMFILSLATLAGAYYLFNPFGAINNAPEQPIPFSHRVHATDKRISCFFCHDYAINTDIAGIPPVQKCMLCHSRIAIHLPAIEQVRQHYIDQKPILWNQLINLQEFVYFSHQAHIQSGFDCGKCHGDVAIMDRVRLAYNLQMGYCISCHEQENASTDCYVCHR